MKKYFVILFISFVFVSCITTKDKMYETLELKRTQSVFILHIETGGHIYILDSMEDITVECIYPDSSIIYISPRDGNRNIINIREIDDSIKHVMLGGFNISYDKLLFPLDLSGVSKDSLYWRDIFYKEVGVDGKVIVDGGVSVGYLNVPRNKKEKFDSILDNRIIKKY